MGRMKPSWYYERQAAEANAREQYYVSKQPPATGTTVNSRGPSTDVYYRSLFLIDGTDPEIFKTSVLTSTLNLVSAADAGLKTSLGTGESAQRLKGSGVKPTKLHWYQGDATPVRVKTPWNSSYTRYYSATGQSHRSMPFSRATGAFDANDLRVAFDGLFGASGTKKSLLGASNGRAYLEPERVPISANS